MANEKDEQLLGKQDPKAELDQGKQQPTDQQNQPSETGQQGQASSGQTDLGQAGETDTLSGERGLGAGSSGGTPGSQSPGGTGGAQGGSGSFVGSQGSGSSDYLQEKAPTAESDSASQARGALEDEDIETGQPQRRDSDIDGSSGNV